MNIELDVKQIFDVAERMEREAASFYTEAAVRTSVPASRSVLLELASMEAEHELVFAGIRSRWAAPQGWAFPAYKVADKLSGHVLVAKFFAQGAASDLARGKFSGWETPRQVIEHAIDVEKETVVFFTSVREMLQNPEDKAKVDDLIREELGHILQLSGQLADLTLPPDKRAGLQPPGDGLTGQAES